MSIGDYYVSLTTNSTHTWWQPQTNGTITIDNYDWSFEPALKEPGIAVNPEQEKALLGILLVLLERAGGRITISEDELKAAAGHVILSEEDAAGLRHVDLLPEYVKIGVEEPEPEPDSATFTFDGTPFTEFTPAKNEWTLTWKPDGRATITEPVSSSKPLSPEAAARLKEAWKKMSTESWRRMPGGGTKVPDDKKTTRQPETPPPPQEGGLQTTDPSFANQTNSAPKESKPASKSDLTRKR